MFQRLLKYCLSQRTRTKMDGMEVVGEIAGWTSSSIWFIVLFPQLYQNQKRQSVQGLDVHWALCNFTASLCHLFFTFQMDLPLFFKCSAIYMPIIEGLILIQFLIFATNSCEKWKIVGGIPVWTAVVTCGLLKKPWVPYLEWGAVVLWSIETLFQVITFNF